MSRRRIYVLDGTYLRPAWEDMGPGHAGSPSRHGELIRGGPGAYEQARITARIRTQRDAELLRVALEGVLKEPEAQT